MIVGGSPKTRKSFLVNGMMHALAAGTPVFGNPAFSVPHPTRGLLFSQELHPAELIRRWRMYLGSDPPAEWCGGLVVVPRDAGVRLDTAAGMECMADYLRRGSEALGHYPDWAVLDPISKFHVLNENDQQSVAILMRNIERLQQSFGGFAAIIIHHFGHPTEEKMMYRRTAALLRGSTHFHADLDAAIAVFYNTPADEHKLDPTLRLEFETRHGAPVPMARVKLDGETTRTLWRGYASDNQEG